MTRLADALKLEEIASDPERALLMDAIAGKSNVCYAPSPLPSGQSFFDSIYLRLLIYFDCLLKNS